MKLNQAIAIESATKPTSYKEFTELNKLAQKQVLFNGFTKTYRKINESGEDFSPERQLVQQKVSDLITKAISILTPAFDITATKDFANLNAVADIKLGGNIILAAVPVPFLLYLEKQLKDVETFVLNLPLLSEDENWVLDANNKINVSDLQTTHRTKKVQRAIVKYDATPEHPAQTELISEDVLVGYWDTKKLSGAISATDKEELVGRVREMQIAVKVAREEANSVDAPKVDTANILKYIFG